MILSKWIEVNHYIDDGDGGDDVFVARIRVDRITSITSSGRWEYVYNDEHHIIGKKYQKLIQVGSLTIRVSHEDAEMIWGLIND